MYKKTIFLLISIATIFAWSCKSGDDFTLDKKFIENETCVTLLDSFRVDLGTILIDSIATSGINDSKTTEQIIQIGAYSDSLFGYASSQPYFKIGTPEIRDIQPDDTFDSIVLMLINSGDFYSNYENQMNIEFSVHRLNQRIELDETSQAIFSHKSFGYDSEPIGKKKVSYQITIGKDEESKTKNKSDKNRYYKNTSNKNYIYEDTIKVRLDDKFGEDLFKLAQINSEYIKTESLFTEYLKGLTLVPDTTNSNGIIGFRINNDDALIRIYSHKKLSYENQYTTDFRITNTNYLYNHIKHDFTGTPLEKLGDQKTTIYSEELNDRAFTQGITGVAIRIEFPTLSELVYNSDIAMLRAQLVLYPEKSSYINHDLPLKLNLYQTNAVNKIGNVLLNRIGTECVPSKEEDKVYNRDTYYTFDITNYISSIFKSKTYDSNNALILSLSSDELCSSFNRLILSSTEQKPELKIYYLKY